MSYKIVIAIMIIMIILKISFPTDQIYMDITVDKGWCHARKEGNVLFNDTLNTFYFTVIWRRTYGKGPLT